MLCEILVYSKVVCAQLLSHVWDPMDCGLPGSSVHEIFQARILEWVAISSCRGSSPHPGFKLTSPLLQADSLLLSYLGSPLTLWY